MAPQVSSPRSAMNIEQLRKKGPGCRVKLVPPACHLDAAGEPLPVQDEDWAIMAVTDEYVEVTTDTGCFCRSGNDHIKNFATDPQRSVDGLNHGFLLLLVQIYVQGSEVKAIPTSRPGEALPPPVNHALKARATFSPELERVFRRQVQILDRVFANFVTTANEYLGRKYPVRPNDTWESLRPTLPRLFPDSAPYQDLSASDAELLAEFYGAVREVADLIDHWAGTMALGVQRLERAHAQGAARSADGRTGGTEVLSRPRLRCHHARERDAAIPVPNGHGLSGAGAGNVPGKVHGLPSGARSAEAATAAGARTPASGDESVSGHGRTFEQPSFF